MTAMYFYKSELHACNLYRPNQLAFLLRYCQLKKRREEISTPIIIVLVLTVSNT